MLHLRARCRLALHSPLFATGGCVRTCVIELRTDVTDFDTGGGANGAGLLA
jgi:hypothetical protein